jgi:hypothetical protein
MYNNVFNFRFKTAVFVSAPQLMEFLATFVAVLRFGILKHCCAPVAITNGM